MTDSNGRVYINPNPPQGLTHKGLAFWAMVFAALILAIGMATGNVDVITIANKVFDVALVLIAAALFNLFFMSKRNKTDETIHSNPVATALYAGAVVIAAAIAST